MIISHQNKTHIYYRKDGNKLGAKKFRLLMYNIEDMVFRNGVYIARNTPFFYIHCEKGPSK